MKLLTKPRNRICFCDRCEAEFVISKRDWRRVRTRQQTERICDINTGSIEFRQYNEHFMTCPICKNEIFVFKRRID